MATLSRQKILAATTGLQATYAACAGGGDVVDNSDGKTFLHVKNGSGGALSVTVTAQNASTVVGGFGTLAVANVVVSVGAGAEKYIGPFPRQAYNNTSDQIAITYSGVTSLTIAAVYMEPI